MRKLILVPTRGRPNNARRLYDSLIDTAHGNVNIMFCVDDNDPHKEDYLSKLPSNTVHIGEPNRLGPWLNLMSDIYAPVHEIVGFVGDDVISRTEGWDSILEAKFHKNVIMYPNDGHQGEGLPTAVFMDANLIVKMGYMVYPQLKHLYIDNHWRELGIRLGTLDYIEEINMEHMHPYAGKAEMDKTYEEANSPERYSVDEFWFRHYRDTVLPYEVRKLL